MRYLYVKIRLPNPHKRFSADFSLYDSSETKQEKIKAGNINCRSIKTLQLDSGMISTAVFIILCGRSIDRLIGCFHSTCGSLVVWSIWLIGCFHSTCGSPVVWSIDWLVDWSPAWWLTASYWLAEISTRSANQERASFMHEEAPLPRELIDNFQCFGLSAT